MIFVVNHEKLQNPLFSTFNVYLFQKAFSSHIAHLEAIFCPNFLTKQLKITLPFCCFPSLPLNLRSSRQIQTSHCLLLSHHVGFSCVHYLLFVEQFSFLASTDNIFPEFFLSLCWLSPSILDRNLDSSTVEIPFSRVLLESKIHFSVCAHF